MADVKLDTTTASLLTKESKDASTGSITAVLCDLEGNALGPGVAPISTLLDANSGKRYGRVAAVLPSLTDNESQAARKAILDRNPVFFPSDDGKFRGFYVPVNDYTYHEAPAAQ